MLLVTEFVLLRDTKIHNKTQRENIAAGATCLKNNKTKTKFTAESQTHAAHTNKFHPPIDTSTHRPNRLTLSWLLEKLDPRVQLSTQNLKSFNSGNKNTDTKI